ncbi:crossover junction endodeoxyribonuclease RuvC [Caldithrix abyssi]|uniref:Crossover junction endodeoxyribonuclease RuvC n=1 Tax=Caldithrix abyssi DSM 13497 TaxID=880073 RepID=H1XP84_CALAY|nr:crossover junction endodeoxyribonuclease RuvC [Caldithrix abyssi]APF18171.1 ruvC Holliday junction endonuclease RuvC [Caldithrix abyssi DSM 13497]EHO42199.1 Crossover junction endodeoxyribonuclease ruvC [Caldithrix abyssi DSM 13497]
MKILGIDPGLQITGFGIIEIDGKGEPKLFEYGHVRTAASEGLSKRVFKIYARINALINEAQPQVMAMESVFYATNVKTAITMGHVRGAVMVAAETSGIPVFEYAPREIKMSVVGNGAASKEQVQFMVQHLLGLKEKIEPIDASDALAAALCYWHRTNLK